MSAPFIPNNRPLTADNGLSRRAFLQAAASGGTAAMTSALFVGAGWLSASPASSAAGADAYDATLYSDLLKTWCDGLLAVQIDEPANPGRHGAFRCPTCSILHGRCADAAYPLLRMAKVTGDKTYLEAARRVFRWAEANVSQSDGSWIVAREGTWKGISVFGAIALAESLHHYGDLLDAATRQEWLARLERAMVFLDKFMTMSGNINYPAASALAFTLAGEVLGNTRYKDRGREFAHACMEYLTPNGLLFGEGKPPTETSPKNCRPVDLGYNVEESLPSLAMYAVLTGDQKVRAAMVSALRTHLEFMLPDGGWDNSWGTRQAKWTWWGSRTSDGCQAGMILLAGDDPRFREAALRNTRLMADCTHGGLLHGGPHYHRHGDAPCVHHTFTHAKALATALDRCEKELVPTRRLTLPREEAKGLRHFPEIGTYLAAAGPWRATVTEYDIEYHGAPGGHPSGGAMSLLYHLKLGPILAASMTEYALVEKLNMQTHGDKPVMCLTPRLEYADGEGNFGTAYTNLSDFTATLSAEKDADGGMNFHASGRLVSTKRSDPESGAIRYHLMHRIEAGKIIFQVSVQDHASRPVKFILPVICAQDETFESVPNQGVRITKPGGVLEIRTDAPTGWEPIPAQRVFNLVPGFECLPLMVSLPADGQVKIEITASS